MGGNVKCKVMKIDEYNLVKHVKYLTNHVLWMYYEFGSGTPRLAVARKT